MCEFRQWTIIIPYSNELHWIFSPKNLVFMVFVCQPIFVASERLCGISSLCFFRWPYDMYHSSRIDVHPVEYDANVGGTQPTLNFELFQFGQIRTPIHKLGLFSMPKQTQMPASSIACTRNDVPYFLKVDRWSNCVWRTRLVNALR